MGWFSKTNDPMQARQRTLEREISRLQKRITYLSAQPPPQVKLNQRQPSPSVRGVLADRPIPTPAPRPSSLPSGGFHSSSAPLDRYNLVEAWARWKTKFGPRPRTPSGLVTLMAAGSVHGLRPLRYERKIARRRFLLSLSFLLLILYGIARIMFRNSL